MKKNTNNIKVAVVGNVKDDTMRTFLKAIASGGIDIDAICTSKSVSGIDINIMDEDVIKCIDQPGLIDTIMNYILQNGEDITPHKKYFYSVLSNALFNTCKKYYFKDMTLGQARMKLLKCCKEIVSFYGDDNGLISTEPQYWADYEIETSYQVRRLFKEKAGIEISLKLAYYIWDYVSDEVCASWLCHEDDDEAWKRIISFILNGDHMKGEKKQ